MGSGQWFLLPGIMLLLEGRAEEKGDPGVLRGPWLTFKG